MTVVVGDLSIPDHRLFRSGDSKFPYDSEPVLIVERYGAFTVLPGQRLLGRGGRSAEIHLLDVADFTIRADRGNEIGQISIRIDAFTGAEGLPSIIDTSFDDERIGNLSSGAGRCWYVEVQWIGREAPPASGEAQNLSRRPSAGWSLYAGAAQF